MTTKDKLLLTLASLAFGWLILNARPTIINSATPKSTLVIDTITPIKPQVVVHDVNGKKALFIGDSHTAADYGWQYQVAKKTGMAMLNTAVGGKQTPWMLEIAKQNIHPGFDYCFIYGGANDMASNRQPMKAVKNIQAIVDLCLKKQVKPIVITGFDPLTCVVVGNRTALRGYPQRYARFQQLLVDSIKGATVLKTHCISRTDCGDYLCHMTALGHRKMGEKVISSLAFKKI